MKTPFTHPPPLWKVGNQKTQRKAHGLRVITKNKLNPLMTLVDPVFFLGGDTLLRNDITNW